MSEMKKFAEELKKLKNDLLAIFQRMESLEKQLLSNEKEENIGDIANISLDISLKDKFVDYLYTIAKVQESSIVSYLKDLKRVRRMLLKYLNVDLPCEIFEIGDNNFLKKLTDVLFEKIEFIQYNKKHHYHYSAPLNNYLEFLSYNKNSFVFED